MKEHVEDVYIDLKSLSHQLFLETSEIASMSIILIYLLL